MKAQWQLPDLTKARKRVGEVEVLYDQFELTPEQKSLGNNKTYFIKTYGCQANERDSETIAGILQTMGYTPGTVAEESDVILLNTCSIRENANNKVFGEIGALKHVKRNNPDVIIGVCGCMTQEEVLVKRILKTYHQVDLIFGTHNIHRLPDLLTQAYFSKERTVEVFSKEGDIIENLPTKRFNTIKAWVNIMYGCDKFCTYCIVPFTRGKERSRLVKDIVEEVIELKNNGYQEVTLLGQNVNAYGKDLAIEDGFAKLLEEVAKTGIPRIRFTTSHPWNFTDLMIETIAKYENIMPYIHLPLQSGSDDVLRRMGRRYTIKEYMDVFNKIKETIPRCAVSTDIIVGFPNETDEQFQQTLDVFNECQYDNAYTFIFSPRSGTPAAALEDDILMETKRERLQQLNVLVKKYSLQNNLSYVGESVDVLVEGPSKKDETIYTGYTPQQKLVNFTADEVETGSIVKVKIIDAKTWYLIGQLEQ